MPARLVASRARRVDCRARCISDLAVDRPRECALPKGCKSITGSPLTHAGSVVGFVEFELERSSARPKLDGRAGDSPSCRTRGPSKTSSERPNPQVMHKPPSHPARSHRFPSLRPNSSSPRHLPPFLTPNYHYARPRLAPDRPRRPARPRPAHRPPWSSLRERHRRQHPLQSVALQSVGTGVMAVGLEWIGAWVGDQGWGSRYFDFVADSIGDSID